LARKASEQAQIRPLRTRFPRESNPSRRNPGKIGNQQLGIPAHRLESHFDAHFGPKPSAFTDLVSATETENTGKSPADRCPHLVTWSPCFPSLNPLRCPLRAEAFSVYRTESIAGSPGSRVTSCRQSMKKPTGCWAPHWGIRGNIHFRPKPAAVAALPTPTSCLSPCWPHRRLSA
jgi:hypothetical protein